MRFPLLKKGDKVDIRWVDAYDVHLDSWATDKEIMQAIENAPKEFEVESRGFFYCEYGNHIYIYGDKSDQHCSRITGIPKGCIIKIRKEKK